MRTFWKGLVLSALVLTVASPASAQSENNEAMARNVAQTLKESGRLKNYRVGVKYQDGVAWLLGTVASQQQWEIAQAVAAETEGVTEVVNKLQVVDPQEQQMPPTASRAPVSLAAAPVEERLAVPTRAVSTMMDSQTAPRLGPPPRRIAPEAQQLAAQPVRPPAAVQTANHPLVPGMGSAVAPAGGPMPIGYSPQGMARTVSHDHAAMPPYAWPSYAAYPNYAALTYPQQYSAAAWPYIGPFYPYPQVPLGWRKVTLEWDDGWWFLDFNE